MPLDVTHQALFTGGRRRARWRPSGRGRAGSSQTCCGSSASSTRALRLGWLARSTTRWPSGTWRVPDLVRTEAYRVDVETTSELTRGRTVVDLHGLTGEPPNVDVGVAIDRDRFIDVLVDAVAAMGPGSRVTEGPALAERPLRYVAPRELVHDRHVGRDRRTAGRTARRGEGCRALRARREPRRERLHVGRRHPRRAAGPGRAASPEFVSAAHRRQRRRPGRADRARTRRTSSAILDALLGGLPPDAHRDRRDPGLHGHPGRRRLRRPAPAARRHRGATTPDPAAPGRRARDRLRRHLRHLASRRPTDRSLVADDGLHPSGAQYALWVERIAPVVGGLLAP